MSPGFESVKVVYLVVNKRQAEGMGKEQDGLVLGIIYGRCRDIALDTANSLDRAYNAISSGFHCISAQSKPNLREFLRV